MKVEDALKTFSFLSELTWWGIIGLMIVVSVIIILLLPSLLEKIAGKGLPVKPRLIYIILFAANTGLLLIILQARRNNDYNLKANCIKSYMVDQNWLFVGYERLAREVDYPDDELRCGYSDSACVVKRMAEMKDVVKEFPDEFIPSMITDNDKTDSVGIKLVDNKAIMKIDSQLFKQLPLFTKEIITYLKTISDTLTYDEVRAHIDSRCDNNSLERIIAISPELAAILAKRDSGQYPAIMLDRDKPVKKLKAATTTK